LDPPAALEHPPGGTETLIDGKLPRGEGRGSVAKSGPKFADQMKGKGRANSSPERCSLEFTFDSEGLSG
jgi:hypothetical protein